MFADNTNFFISGVDIDIGYQNENDCMKCCGIMIKDRKSLKIVNTQ